MDRQFYLNVLKFLQNDNKNFSIIKIMNYLDYYAELFSTDPRIFVGCALYDKQENLIGWGYNGNENYNEKVLGQTYREWMFKSRDKKYRLWDKIIHAEENAFINLLKCSSYDSAYKAVITRYPCEKCAQFLVYKGVKEVIYGRPFKISEETDSIFKKAGVKVTHFKDYVGDETDHNN